MKLDKILNFRSIRARITFYIVFVIFIITSFRIGYIYSIKNQNMIDDMTQDINNLVNIASNAVKRPLWSFDLENIEDIANSIIMDKNMAEIIITDQYGMIIMMKNKALPESSENFLKRNRQIFFNNEHIGNISISFTNKYYLQNMRIEILKEIFLSLLEVAILGWIILFISSKITKPIANITNIAESISKGNLENEIIVHSLDEVGALELTIKSMQTQIKEHISEIELNHNEIQALYEETTAMNEELENLVETLDKNYRETIMVLANAIEASDAYTRGHCERVQKYSRLIAEEIGMGMMEKRTLDMAAILHDIGKIGVSIEILNKETTLSAEEYSEIKKHSDIGYQILKDVEFLSESAQIVFQHHERYDGNGYNNGICGDNILLSARIICIADAYDAMTTSRAYRKTPLTKEQAIEELKKGKGTQFDSQLVDVFLNTITKHL